MIIKETEKLIDEQRKLQVTGGSTFILSLPKDWVTKNELKRGNSMIIREEDDGSLSISPSSLPKQGQPKEAFIKISQTDNPDAIMRTVISAYLNGYNIIHIRAQSQKSLPLKLRTHLKTFARNYLVGTEIVTDTTTDLTVQVLLNYPQLTVQNALSHMSIIASSMHKEAVQALIALDYSGAKVVVETDREVNRFGLYIVRLLKIAVTNSRFVKKIGLDNQKYCLGYHLIVKSVERSADHATKIAENILFLKETVDEGLLNKITQLSELTNTMFETAIGALFKNDFHQAELVIERIEQVYQLEKKVVHYFQVVKVGGVANLRLLIESVRCIAEYARDISKVVLDLTVESVLS
ncbi:MAG: phosphate uptake regulator PhoU [Candidatus Bathyarchaeota archaeon]|nr:phosphate uptake regulator PhoU [Candidatus Termiticorpusculum sp.]